VRVLKVSRSPHRLLAFFISTLLIVVAGLLDAITQAQGPLFFVIDQFDMDLLWDKLSESFRVLS
jgi:hypothetical protein